MISETTFAQNYTSTWRLLAPAIDLCIRKINLQEYDREFPPLISETFPGRRGFINELAFRLFCASLNGGSPNKLYAIEATKAKLAELKSSVPQDLSLPSDLEMMDCDEQLSRLQNFFRRIAAGYDLEPFPRFPGSGIINTCEGDIVFGETLFEIKAGQRSFRAVDLKQLLTYAALNYSSGVRKLAVVGLFNPRMGISFSATLDELSLEVSGCTSHELLPEIVRVISSGDISR